MREISGLEDHPPPLDSRFHITCHKDTPNIEILVDIINKSDTWCIELFVLLCMDQDADTYPSLLTPP